MLRPQRPRGSEGPSHTGPRGISGGRPMRWNWSAQTEPDSQTLASGLPRVREGAFDPAPKTREWNKSHRSALRVKKTGGISWIG
jgi:hypothetical protein